MRIHAAAPLALLLLSSIALAQAVPLSTATTPSLTGQSSAETNAGEQAREPAPPEPFATLPAGHSLPQSFSPDELVIEDIRCAGNAASDCDFLKSELRLSVGERVDQQEVRNAELRLRLLGIFRTVDIVLQKGHDRGHAILEIQVEEESPYVLEMTTGSISDNLHLSQSFSGGFGHHNLMGTGKILSAQLYAQKGINRDHVSTYATRLDYLDPYFLGSKRFFLSASLYATRFSERTLGVDVTGNWLTSRVSVGLRFGDFSFVTLGYGRTFVNDLVVIYEGQTYSYPRVGPNLITLSYGWNSLNDPVFPTSGSLLSLGLAQGFPVHGIIALGGAFQKCWSVGAASVLTFNLGYLEAIDKSSIAFSRWQARGEDLPISLGYSYDIRRNHASGTIRNARLTVDGGFKELGAGAGGSSGLLAVMSPGAKATLSLDIASLGVAQFYFLYQQDVLPKSAR